MPGTYLRLLLIGYFERIDFERGHAWRTADSLALVVCGIGLDEVTPEQSTISRTRRLIDLKTHRSVFTWILQVKGMLSRWRGCSSDGEYVPAGPWRSPARSCPSA
jgi:hypothetical protein